MKPLFLILVSVLLLAPIVLSAKPAKVAEKPPAKANIKASKSVKAESFDSGPDTNNDNGSIPDASDKQEEKAEVAEVNAAKEEPSSDSDSADSDSGADEDVKPQSSSGSDAAWEDFDENKEKSEDGPSIADRLVEDVTDRLRGAGAIGEVAIRRLNDGLAKFDGLKARDIKEKVKVEADKWKTVVVNKLAEVVDSFSGPSNASDTDEESGQVRDGGAAASAAEEDYSRHENFFTRFVRETRARLDLARFTVKERLLNQVDEMKKLVHPGNVKARVSEVVNNFRQKLSFSNN